MDDDLGKTNHEFRRTVTDNKELMSFLKKLEMGDSLFPNWNKCFVVFFSYFPFPVLMILD